LFSILRLGVDLAFSWGPAIQHVEGS
jgi:hypothetical protein